MLQVARPKAFVLEDEPIIAMDIEDTLRGLGFDVSIVADPTKIIAAIATQPLALVVLNVRTNGATNSIAAAAAARNAGIPMVLCSSGEPPLGFDEVPFVDSPFSLEGLHRAVQTVLDAAQNRAAGGRPVIHA